MYGYKKKFVSRRPAADYLLSGREISRTRLQAFRKKRTSDKQQLARIVNSYRASNPYQIVPSSGRTCTFWRKTELSLVINQLNGFGVGGNNLNFGFSLKQVFGILNGAFTYGPTFPSTDEFQALFDYYQIRAVKMQMFFTKTNNDQSSGATLGMPMILMCNDFDDIAETMTLSTMNQRVGCRHVQFDANNTNGITQYIKPKPNSVVVQTDVGTGVQSSSNAGVTFGTQWLDIATSNIVHNGIKVFYDNQGLTTNANLGNITFVFDMEIVCKGYR